MISLKHAMREEGLMTTGLAWATQGIANNVNVIIVNLRIWRFGRRSPRRWGWRTPLKKRTASRIKIPITDD